MNGLELFGNLHFDDFKLLYKYCLNSFSQIKTTWVIDKSLNFVVKPIRQDGCRLYVY